MPTHPPNFVWMAAALALLIGLADASLADARGASERLPLRPDAVVHVTVSSTSEARLKERPRYHRDALIDGRPWSAWASAEGQGAGAWIELELRRTEYLSAVILTPGDPRQGSRCDRPARVRITAGERREIITLKDRRWPQTLRLDPPLSGRSVRLEVLSAYGRRGRHGVCLSEIAWQTPADVLASVPHLRAQIAQLDALLDAGDLTAARALTERLGAPATPAVLRRLNAKDTATRLMALDLLVALQARETVGPIGRLYHGPEIRPVVQARALWALVALGVQSELKTARAWFHARSGTDQDLAFDALVRAGHPDDLHRIAEGLAKGPPVWVQSVVDHLGRHEAEPAFEALQPLLTSPSPMRRARGCLALGAVAHPHSAGSLRQALADPADEVQAAALTALVRRGGASALAEARDRVAHRSARVRAAAAQALGQVGSRVDLPKLETLAGDHAASVRLAAAHALVQRGRSARSHLEAILARTTDARVARAAAQALIREADEATLVGFLAHSYRPVREAALAAFDTRREEGTQALLRAAVHTEGAVRQVALSHLQARGGSVVPDLIRLAERAPSGPRADLLRTLAALGDSAAWPAGRRALGGSDPQVRAAGMLVVGRCGPVSANRVILDHLTDRMAQVRAAAMQAAASRRLGQAVPILSAELVRSEVPQERHAIAQLLGEIGDPAALKPLAEAYERHLDRFAADPDLRALAVLASTRIDAASSMPLLMQALTDPDPGVQAAARAGLELRR